MSVWTCTPDVPKSYRLDLVSSTAFSNGIVGDRRLRRPIEDIAAELVVALTGISV
jgi:hypothetical protein